MKDAVSLIGKNIRYGGTTYIIDKIYFIPQAIHSRHNYYFGLKALNNTWLNVSYTELLPYLKEQIKL